MDPEKNERVAGDNGAEDEPEESGSVATGADGVGNINNHIKAVLGRGT